MRRVVEPELMVEAGQVRAYADADFEAAHAGIMAECFARFPALPPGALVADLGCGAGDIAVRLTKRYPNCQVHAFDGSQPMLDCAARATAQAGVAERVHLQQAVLPDLGALGRRCGGQYAMVASNSLLHHLHDPSVLWRTVRALAAPKARVFIADLRRPDDAARARAMVEQYAAGEPEVLRRDFHNSLRAAFAVDEVRAQLRAENLNLEVAPLGDRHMTIHGVLAGA